MNTLPSARWALLLLGVFALEAGAQAQAERPVRELAPAAAVPAAAAPEPPVDVRTIPVDKDRFREIAEVPGKCPPQGGTELSSTAPPSAPPYMSEDKRDDTQSPDSFPLVPGQGEWLDAYLGDQYSVLQKLYTTEALANLGPQESACGYTGTARFCRMRVRMFWISRAVE